MLGTKNKQVPATLLNQKGLTLDKALTICRGNEMAKQHLLRINDAGTSTVRAVRCEAKKTSFQQKTEEKDRKQTQPNCRYCGLEHAKRQCPAHGKTCHKCKKKHFASFCKTKTKGSVNLVNSETDSDITDELYSLTHEVGAFSTKGKRWFVNKTSTLRISTNYLPTGHWFYLLYNLIPRFLQNLSRRH